MSTVVIYQKFHWWYVPNELTNSKFIKKTTKQTPDLEIQRERDRKCQKL